jgi:uncharacterized protein YodC (DUF2158 family)
MEFKTGDVVRLKSGGALMTVDELTNLGYRCKWHNKDKELKEAYFKAETLDLIDDGSDDDQEQEPQETDWEKMNKFI